MIDDPNLAHQTESVEAVRMLRISQPLMGFDYVMMGPLDLSAAMGWLGDPVNKKVKEALLDHGSGAYLAGFAIPNDGPDELRDVDIIWCVVVLM